jgi:hemoglobin
MNGFPAQSHKGIGLAGTVVGLLIGTMIAGCAGPAPQSKKPEFFTSGSREADQRADQRMVRDQQIKSESVTNKSDKAASEANAKKTLYDRLGGDYGMKAIVDDFTARVLADPRVNFQRKGVKYGGFNIHSNRSMTWDPNPGNVAKLKLHLVQFLAVATGGPSQYDGRPMGEVHAGMHISNPEYDAAVGDLKTTLDKLKVADKEQKELLAIIESARPEIAEER